MKTNVCLISSLRKPFSSLLLLILFGLITFGFVTKAVEFILVQRETGVLGSYYRSIGVLENVKDPQAGDISAGIELIQKSPDFAYGDQREIVSGVMHQTYNTYQLPSNTTDIIERYPKEDWPNTHTTDIWFTGELIKTDEVKTLAKQPKIGKTVGYYLRFNIDTLYAAYPEYARQGQPVGLIFLFDGHEAAIPIIQEMEVGQRYFIHAWFDSATWQPGFYANDYAAVLQIIPLGDGQPWYLPLAKDASVDFSTPAMAAIQNEIDVLNENLHTLSIVATADMSAMPRTQEASRFYYLTAGRWLNHQDDRARAKVIVVPDDFSSLRGLKLGDEITLTFRPLTDTYFGFIRDGVDSLNWRSYPTYQDTFKIVGFVKLISFDTSLYAYIPTSSLRPGFASTTQIQFNDENDYSFVLDTSRHETQFTQAYKAPLQALGISLTFLPNNGPAYWAAVDPIRRSSSADVLVFGLLMVVALSMAVFLYVIARTRDYAILRALGVPRKQANAQLVLPLLLLGGLGMLAGGLPAWNYALGQAKVSLSSLPTPAGVAPTADLSPFVLAGLCGATFLFLAAFSWLGVFFLAHRPVYELLQGQASRPTGGQKRPRTGQPVPSLSSSSSPAGPVLQAGSPSQAPAGNPAALAPPRKYTPSSLGRYVFHHALRSRLKSSLTLAIALGFLLASGWIRQTMVRSRIEIDHLYDTTVVQADILPADPSASSTGETRAKGTGFVYLKTIDSLLNSGFVQSSVLEADTVWPRIGILGSSKTLTVTLPVYAYDSPDAFYAGLADPASLRFAAGWDMERFAGPQTLEDIQQAGVPALFPASLLEALQLEVGEKIQITDSSMHTYPCVIVGQYSGGRDITAHGGKIPWIYSPSDSILIPLSTLESMQGSQTKFTVAHFNLDPKKNRELAQLGADMEKAMEIYTGQLRFIIWDEELKIVVAQLDKNLSLLKVLYPVVMAASVLIGAGLCFLLLLQATREAAILRVLGTTRTAVLLALIVEPLFLSVIGVIIGLGISRLLWRSSGLVPAGSLLIGAGLYLAGVLVGLVTGAISVTNKKPIELLQVKE